MAKGNGTTANMEIIKNRIALLVIILLLSAILATLWFNFMPSQINVDFLQPKIEFRNMTSVFVEEETLFILDTRYESDNEEFIYCLYGKSVEGGYLIEEMEQTEVITAEMDYITYKPCFKTSRYLGTIHSHPPQGPRTFPTCELSKQDAYTFASDGAHIAGIICGPGKHAFYAPDNLQKSLKVTEVEIKNGAIV